MAGKFKKSTSYFDVAAEKAEERQQKSLRAHLSPRNRLRRYGKPGARKRALKGHLRGLYSCLSTFPRAIASD